MTERLRPGARVFGRQFLKCCFRQMRSDTEGMVQRWQGREEILPGRNLEN